MLQDKLITLRKQKGWSQEELAMQLNVSRQSVSKWESGQSLPDIDKIIQLSTIFEVTTDFLLKDDNHKQISSDYDVTYLSEKEVLSYIHVKKITSKYVAIATLLCIISPTALIILHGNSETKFAKIIGISILLLCVAIAVMIYITCRTQTKPYQYLQTTKFQLNQQTKQLLQNIQKDYLPTYTKTNQFATFLYIISYIPILMAQAFSSRKIQVYFTALTITIIGVAVFLFIMVGTKWHSYNTLLNRSLHKHTYDYEHSYLFHHISTIYWCIISSLYLGWSFIYHDWDISWIIWPIAGVFSSAIRSFCILYEKKKK